MIPLPNGQPVINQKTEPWYQCKLVLVTTVNKEFEAVIRGVTKHLPMVRQPFQLIRTDKPGKVRVTSLIEKITKRRLGTIYFKTENSTYKLIIERIGSKNEKE